MARSIRAFAFLVPVVVSAVVVYLLDQRFRPTGLALRILWIAFLVALAVGISRVLVSVTQRLLPVAMLYRMSLVFPDNEATASLTRPGTTYVHQGIGAGDFVTIDGGNLEFVALVRGRDVDQIRVITAC